MLLRFAVAAPERLAGLRLGGHAIFSYEPAPQVDRTAAQAPDFKRVANDIGRAKD